MAKLRDFLKDKLTKKELSIVPSSFDMVGSIIIFSDFPKELKKKERVIGQAILKNFKHVRSVYKKIKKYSGTFRTPKLELIAGEDKKETEHKESNARIRLNVEKVYFSPRLSEERKRIFSRVKKGEGILVMFSGIAIYPIVISRNAKAKKIVGIEINPIAHKYAIENLKLNKATNVKLILGDVKKIIPKLNIKFDRIIMPLPKGAEGFLGLALDKIKKSGTIHFYSFSEENKYEDIAKIIENGCKNQKKKCKILNIVKCGQSSPGVFRVCVDFKVF